MVLTQGYCMLVQLHIVSFIVQVRSSLAVNLRCKDERTELVQRYCTVQNGISKKIPPYGTNARVLVRVEFSCHVIHRDEFHMVFHNMCIPSLIRTANFACRTVLAGRYCDEPLQKVPHVWNFRSYVIVQEISSTQCSTGSTVP